MRSIPFILTAIVLLALTGLQAQAAPVLVARYTLDETGTSIFDWSGNGLHGTRGVDSASTGVWGTNYIQGSAAAAFGNNSQHSINLGSPDILDFRPGVDEFSISTWFRVPSDTSGTLVSKAVDTGSDRQYQLLIESNRLHTRLGGVASSYGSTTVTDNKVHHVVWSVSALGYNVYLDGNPTPHISGSVTGSKLNAGQNVYIGARTDGSGFMLTGGWLDDIQFYQGALTPAQASYLYNNPGDWLPLRVLAYRETFPNDSGSDRSFGGGAVEGWKAHYTAAGIASAGTVISGGEGSRPLAPFNSSPDHSNLTRGYYSRSGYLENYLHWTEEFDVGNIDQVRSFQWDQRNGATDLFHAAVRLDVDGTPDTSDDIWYASVQTFTNADAQSTFTNTSGHTWHCDVTFDFVGAQWLELDFVPDTTLALDLGGDQMTLPSGVAMTGFGLYTPNVPSYQRFDNFRVFVPEPGAFGLLALALMTLVLPRRRRR